MTLHEIIRMAEMVASQQPSVNMVVRNDIFRLNACQDAKYGVFGWTQGEHSGNVSDSVMTYQFTFFYVDRLTEDRGNELEVQSVGVETLRNILVTLDENGVWPTDAFTVRTFNQRFVDECAGAFVNVRLAVPVNAICPDRYGDFNNDFNDDFFIY